MQSRGFFFASAAWLVSSILSPTLASARPLVDLQLQAAQVVVATHTEKLVPLKQGVVHTGEIIRYTIIAKNSGDRPATRFTPSATIPVGTVLISAPLGSASILEVSRDHGRHWISYSSKSLANLTSIRWKFLTPLNRAQSVSVHYDVKAL